MKSVGLSSETSSVGWDTAYRPTEKLGKEASTSIAMPNFDISTRRPWSSWLRTSRSFQSTRKNGGQEWRRKGSPELVNVHDFIDPKLRRAVPYGVYDLTNNVGRVSVGTDRDTATFAVNTIRRWWRVMGNTRKPSG
jgi:Rhodopirellula transposase DDE domain